MRSHLVLTLMLLAGLSVAAHASSPSAVPVELHRQGEGWVLLRNHHPYFIRGAGGGASPELLRQMGGNSLRTWEADPATLDRLLPEAQRLGLTVTVGLPMLHERHGFRYDDAAQVEQQKQRNLASVRRYKNSPAVLLWGVGNEMEGEGENPLVWQAINAVAREIHAIDPLHPVMTVIAGVGRNGSKLKAFMKYCPDVDILGINSYGGMFTLIDDVRAAKLDRPFVATEFGPLGWWERPRSEWGAPLEQTSSEKAESYRAAYEHSITPAAGRSLGSYAFLWGAKQERTHTWFGLVASSAPGAMPEKTEAVDVLSYEWSGHWPKHRAPHIAPILSPINGKRVAPGSEWEAFVSASGEGPLRYEWLVLEETHDAREGGDKEEVPPAHPEAIVHADGPRLHLHAPSTPGAYRLFVAVHDTHGSVATANVTFFVEGK